MSDKPMTSEVSVEANSDKMVQRAAELGIPYDAARAIYSEAFRDGFGNYDALRDQLDEYVRVVGEQQSQVETLKAENERLDGLAALESANAASYLARAEKAEAADKFHRECLDVAISRRKEAEAELSELRAFKKKMLDLFHLLAADPDLRLNVKFKALAAKEPGKEG